MIHRIHSSLKSFKTLEFHSGLNVLIAEKEAGASDRQTRNRAGKTSMVEVVHFLMGAEVRKDSLFRTKILKGESFGMVFELGGEFVEVERSAGAPSRIYLSGAGAATRNGTVTQHEWLQLLGEQMFGLGTVGDYDGRKPTFRSLFAYFVRRQNAGAFTAPEKQATMQQAGDYQVALMFLLGLDWKIASAWQKVRDREKTMKELRKAAREGAFGSVIGTAAELRTQLTVAESQLAKLKERVASFRVLAQYRELESEADELTRKQQALANEDTIDRAVIRDIGTALEAESPPELCDLEQAYKEAGIVLPGVSLRRYDEVRSFHQSVIRNRRDYLSGELERAQERVKSRAREREALDRRRAEIMEILQSHGALDQLTKLQGELARLEAQVEALRQRYESAEQIEGTKNRLKIDRNQLELRLRQDFSEQHHRLDEAILAFEEVSHRLYESAGSMMIEPTYNGPAFQFPMQGSRSKGIKNMQIFCFDMMLMRLCARRRIGPGFLIHDSHLFDGVDGRQVISALKIGAETAEELGFQYIVTMNEDDAFKETIRGFDLRRHLLPVTLTDADEDGGLFGIRFEELLPIAA